MAENVSLVINGYNFDPVPQSIAINKSMVRTGAGCPINIIYSATLEGKIFTDHCRGGNIASVMEQRAYMCQKIGDCGCCVRMDLKCNSTTLFAGYVKIVSVNFQPSSDNWATTIPYTIEVEWTAAEDFTPTYMLNSSGVIEISDPSGLGTPEGCFDCINSVDESWDISPADNTYLFNIGPECSGNAEVFQITHNVSAQGMDCCDVSGNLRPGWENARAWVLDNIKCTPDIDCSGVFGTSDLEFFDLRRSKTYNKTTGDFSVTETWTALTQTGQPRCIEDFTVTCANGISDYITTYTIAGTITGFETRQCDTSGLGGVTTTKIESAKACWETIQPQLIKRIECLAAPSGCAINTSPTQKNTTFNPFTGSVSYSYSYTDRVQLIPGSISETISFNDILPSEQISTTNVIGRRSPLIERCGVINLLQKTLNIQVVLPRNCAGLTGTLCTDASLLGTPDTSGVDQYICCVEAALEAAYDNVVLTQNTSNFNSSNGVYSRVLTWALQNCNQSLPDLGC